MDPILTVQGLSKAYTIGTRLSGHDRYRTLRESISESVSASWTGLRRRLTTRDPAGDGLGWNSRNVEKFWALNDVSFEVQPGEVVGIIGRNGAGKSTLLKMLSRIAEPTDGRIELRGRVGSLLEVGTGFHPELTGRENIFLNGSILGMSRREIAHCFDEIVAFAEVERFLDTPVKRYSSGMYVRLAFSVAAHLEPEVLIVDEVLAVGDATYQKRCIDRMASLAASGLTVLFVSHNMDLIPRLCGKAIQLDRGRVVREGLAESVVEQYLRGMIESGQAESLQARPRSGDGRARFRRIQLVGPDGRAQVNHRSGEDLTVRITIEANQVVRDAAIAINLKTLYGARVFSGWTREAGFSVAFEPGEQTLDCRFDGVRIRPGQRVAVELWMESGTVIDHVEDSLVFEVIDGPGTDRFSTDLYQGFVLCDYEWSIVGAGRSR